MDARSFGTDSRGSGHFDHHSSATHESSFNGSRSIGSASSFHEKLEDIPITLTGLEGFKIKASKTVLSSCNELIAEAIEEQKDAEAVNLGDYTMRALLGLVEFCQHNELSEAAGIKTKSSAIALSDLYQIASDYMFHDLTRHVYDSATEMLDAVPSLGCVFMKRNNSDSALYRLGLKTMRMNPKEALEDADDDLLKKLNKDRLKVVVKAVDWKEHDPELLPHILVKWICAWGGLPVKVEIARGHTKTMHLPDLDERIYEACKCVGMCITDQNVALEGYKGCRIFTNRAMISAANEQLKELLEEHPDDKTVFLGNYSMRAVLGLVEFCQHKDFNLTLGEKKKTAAIALAELSQIARDHMFMELEEHVYKTVSSMIKGDPWLAFVMLKRTKPGTPLYKLGTKTFRLFPKECLSEADDELLKKLNRDRLNLVVEQVDWTQKEHDLLPHVLANWICAWDGLPVKIEIARACMKKAKIDVDGLPSLVLDIGKMTGLIDDSMLQGNNGGDPDITLLGHRDCRVRVVKAVVASRNSQLKELLYKDSASDKVFIGDYSKRAIIALAEYCHHDHFCKTLGTKDVDSAYGLTELAKIAANYMFEDLAKDVYQACVRLLDAEPSMALVLFRRCAPHSALNKLALRTFRFRLKDSLLMAPPVLQKQLDNKRMSGLVDQMKWKDEPQMLLKVLVEWVKIWDAKPAQIHHARYIARDINISDLPDDVLLRFQKTGLVNPSKIRAIMLAREEADGGVPPTPSTDAFSSSSQPDGVVCDDTVATAPTTTNSSAAESEAERSWLGLTVSGEGGSDIVSVLDADCTWVNST